MDGGADSVSDVVASLKSQQNTANAAETSSDGDEPGNPYYKDLIVLSKQACEYILNVYIPNKLIDLLQKNPPNNFLNTCNKINNKLSEDDLWKYMGRINIRGSVSDILAAADAARAAEELIKIRNGDGMSEAAATAATPVPSIDAADAARAAEELIKFRNDDDGTASDDDDDDNITTTIRHVRRR